MNYKKLKNIYINSPNFVKTLYSLIPWSIRMGSEYRKTYNFLTLSERWTNDQWHTYQTEELRKLLRYCYDSIPYYHELFMDNNIDIEGNDIWNEFYKIPFMTKEVLVKNIERLVPKKVRVNMYSSTTGGTTGKPITIYYDKKSYKQEWAYKMFFWDKAIGYSILNKKATFRGTSYSSPEYFHNPIYNEIKVSPFKLEGENIEKIVNKLKQYQPEYLHGYPSALEKLAKYLSQKKDRIGDIKGVILISENYFDHQVALFQKIFDCPVYSFYGLSERVIMASMDSNCNGYFAHPAYGITELIDENGVQIDRLNALGELVGTGFINRGMPLLRYRTADFSSWDNNHGSLWNMPKLGAIVGRKNQEYLAGKNSKKISMMSLNIMDSTIYNNVRNIQFYQEKEGIVQLNIVRDHGYTKSDEDKIRYEIMNELGSEFTLTFNYLDSLPLTQAGKSKYLIQKLSI